MQITKRLTYYAALVFLAYMPFHVFVTQWLSLYTGGLDIWKIAKDVLLAVITLFVVCSVMVTGRATRTFRWLLYLTTSYALLHAILWLTHPDIYRTSAILGFTYNLRLPCFALVGLGAGLLWPQLRSQTFIKLTLALGAVVTVLGVIQYFLPKDFMMHFGYSISRGARAAFYIDDKSDFPRIMSTLREPNSLAAYLLVPLTLTVLLWARVRRLSRKLILGSIIGLELVAILITFSRSGWIAAAISVGLALAWQYRVWVTKVVRQYWMIAVVLLVVGGAAAYAQRNTSFVKGYVSHTSNDGDLSSNDYHRIFLERGLKGIVHDPFGHGPGTAGLASIQNPKGSFLTENYYVQIGYETGIVGLLIFIGLNVLLYYKLWQRRTELLPTVLLATFWGYVVMNMLLHIWSNEAVACQWWLLAGLVIGMPGKADERTGQST